MKTKTILLLSLPLVIALFYYVYINVSQKNLLTTDQSITIQTKYLSIIPTRCRGCGKCFRVDPIHFSLDASTGLSKVISQENLDSSDLKNAIALCHDQAISLK